MWKGSGRRFKETTRPKLGLRSLRNRLRIWPYEKVVKKYRGDLPIILILTGEFCQPYSIVS